MLEERIAELEHLLYPSSDTVPDLAWNVFPENASYIRKMLEYRGYSIRRSLASLQNKEEFDNLFAFIRDMAEDMDEDEKRRY